MSVLLTASVTAYANDGDGQPSVAATEKQNEEQSVKPHWEVRSKRKYYIKSDGKYAKYWNNINGYRYYFNSNGQMMTGWLRCKGAWYYLNDYGVMAIGWRYINYKWYYFNQNGVMATYSRIIDGKRYYFYGSGAMHTGWLMIKGLWYYYYNSGAMATDTWIGGTYYVNPNGAWIYNKKKTVDVLLGVRRSNVVSWLSKHEKDRYYLGTPYAGRKAKTSSSGIYGWNPTGCIRPYGRYSGSNPGMNCAGFVADVMAYSGAGWSRVEKIGTRRKSYIAASAWYDYVMANNAEYYYFSTIERSAGPFSQIFPAASRTKNLEFVSNPPIQRK